MNTFAPHFLFIGYQFWSILERLSTEMKQSYEIPVVEEIMISPMKALLQDVSNPNADVPPVVDGGDE